MFLLMNMAFCLAQAQTKSNWGVKGVLLDSLTNEGEPYATIRIVQEKKTSVTESQPLVDLGKLYTSEASEELEGIEVVAQKPLVKAEIDKISYSIADDPDSKTNTRWRR